MHSVESITQTLLIVGSDQSAVERLYAGFADIGWFVLTERDTERALGLLEHLTVSAICLFDDNENLASDVDTFKNQLDCMLFVLSDTLSSTERFDLYKMGVNHVFSTQVLSLEVKTVITTLQQQKLVQSQPETQPVSEDKKWDFCSESRILSVDNRVISSLSYNEAKVLKMLIDNRNETLSRERLMMTLGRFKHNPEDRTLDRLICNLRKKFKKVCPHTQFIISLYGHGYVFTDAQTTQVA